MTNWSSDRMITKTVRRLDLQVRQPIRVGNNGTCSCQHCKSWIEEVVLKYSIAISDEKDNVLAMVAWFAVEKIFSLLLIRTKFARMCCTLNRLLKKDLTDRQIGKLWNLYNAWFKIWLSSMLISFFTFLKFWNSFNPIRGTRYAANWQFFELMMAKPLRFCGKYLRDSCWSGSVWPTVFSTVCQRAASKG